MTTGIRDAVVTTGGTTGDLFSFLIFVGVSSLGVTLTGDAPVPTDPSHRLTFGRWVSEVHGSALRAKALSHLWVFGPVLSWEDGFIGVVVGGGTTFCLRFICGLHGWVFSASFV